MDVQLSFSPDPGSALARQAAEDVRTMFTARVGEVSDSHAAWNSTTNQTVLPLTQGVADRAATGDVVAAAAFAGEWASVYLAASSFISEQLMRTAIAQIYLAQGGDVEDDETAVAFAVEWQARIMHDTFTMLIEEGRTLV
jgi:hypothetical protein